MLLAGDERRHNNPDKAYVDAEFLRGGGKVTANLSTLLTDFVSKLDQLKENVTTVYVISESIVYRLKSIANINSLADGWKKETVDYLIKGNAGAMVNTNATRSLQVSVEATSDAAFATFNRPYFSSSLGLDTDNEWKIQDYDLTGVRPGPYKIFHAGNFNPATKRDKLESFYTTQPASFNISADMVDKIVRCSHATVAIIATIADDSLFAIGARFELGQSGVAGVSLAAAAGITLNAPQGLALSRRYSYFQVVKQAAGVYSVTVIGDDPTKVDKDGSKVLSTNDYTTAEKTKLSSIITGISLCFQAPVREYKDYFENAVQISAITLDGASAFQYSIDNGASYNTVSLPLGSLINIPASKFIRWRVTFASNTTLAGVYLKLL